MMTKTTTNPIPLWRHASTRWALGSALLALAALGGCDSDKSARTEASAEPTASADDCAGKAAAACLERGIALQAGKDGAVDAAGALALFTNACDAGEPSGCTMAGDLLARGLQGDDPGDSVTRDTTRARALYERACEADEPMGCFHAGNAYGVGRLDTPKDPPKAADFLQRACDLGGPPEACEFAGIARKAVEKGFPTPEKWETRCREGHASDCQRLGMALHMGNTEVDKDVARALEIFELGCEAGDGLSCAGVAIILERDLPGADGPDTTRIDGFLQRACDADYARGCRMLGVHLLPDGALLEPDPERAVSLLDKACHAARPDFEACMWLASAVQKGEGVQPDMPRALGLMRRACEQGKLKDACALMER